MGNSYFLTHWFLCHSPHHHLASHKCDTKERVGPFSENFDFKTCVSSLDGLARWTRDLGRNFLFWLATRMLQLFV